MKKKYSGDWAKYILFGIFEPLLFILLWIYAGQKFTPTFIIFIVVYVVFCVRYVRFFKFKEDFYEVSFPVRIIKRKKTIYYSDIESAEYLMDLSKGERILKIYPKMHKTHFWESKYMVACNIKHSHSLLCFLKSKGIKIKINSTYHLEEYAYLLEPEENQQRVRYYR